MRILILNWRDIKHPLAGGAEISTHEHAKAWVKAGHQVIQFASFIQGEKQFDMIDGVQIIRRGSHYTVHFWAFLYYLKNFRNKTDIVIDEFHFIPFFTPLYVRAKIVAFIHETAEKIWFKNQPFPINILGFLLEPFVFKFYKKLPFITVSESTKRDLIKFGINEKNIHIIYNGGGFKKMDSKKENTPTIIYLGRLAKDKGIEDAILTFSYIQREIQNVKLWIVGREEKEGYLNFLKKKVKNLNLDKQIIFFDFVEEKKKFDLLRKAWIFINPSFKEGWGLTVIEAASQGTPTVAYKTHGLIDSIINKKTGLIVDVRESKEMAAKVTALITDKRLYNLLSKNALIWSRKFNWRDSTQKSLDFIKNIL